jgi:uncharacterized protein with HEPN domain
MRRDDELPNDILDALDWISGAVSRVTEAGFPSDETLRYAVAQKRTVVGEAVTRLSAERKANHPTVPSSANTSAHPGPSSGTPLATALPFSAFASIPE